MEQLIHHVALVGEAPAITASQLARAGAALQKQVTRDFGPIWNVTATVDAFPKLKDVPLGYWPVIVRDDIDSPGAAGIHEDKDGQPFALVQYSNAWPLTASHEVLEMLADPFGNRLIAGDSVHPEQGRVEYLVEVCDPSENAAFSYRVNGVMVSDFFTPSYFDPVASGGVRYSFRGAIKKPREVLKGGYLSWHEPVSDEWWQQSWLRGPKPTFRSLGVIRATKSLRSEIDRRTQSPPFRVKGLAAGNKLLAAAAEVVVGIDEATTSKADVWLREIEAIKRQAAEEVAGGEHGAP